VTPVVYAIAGVALLAQLVSGLRGGYGYFIDELYYLACARRLAWGYVDHPPLSIALLWGETALLGTSGLPPSELEEWHGKAARGHAGHGIPVATGRVAGGQASLMIPGSTTSKRWATAGSWPATISRSAPASA
jgi:hypothetical protein